MRTTAEIIDAPKTIKYLTTFVDWRAKDHLRVQQRHRPRHRSPTMKRPPPRRSAGAGRSRSSPEAVLESAHVRDLVADLQTRIPSRVNRLIVHLFFSTSSLCPDRRDRQRLLSVELTAKAVELRKAQTIKAIMVEWNRALNGSTASS